MCVTSLNGPLWRATALLSAISLIGIGATIGVISLFMTPIQNELHWSSVRVSSTASAFMFGYLAAGPPAGWLLDRWQPRGVIMIGALLASLGYFLASTVSGYEAFVIAFVVAGLGAGSSTYVPAIFVITKLAQRPATPIGVIIGSSSAGAALLPPLIGFLITDFGWRTALAAISAALAATALLAALLPRLSARPSAAANPEHIPGSGSCEPGGRNWSISLLFIIGFFSHLAFMGFYVHFIPFELTIGYTSNDAEYNLTLVNIVSAAGIIITGVIADRYKPSGVLSLYLAVHACVLLCLALPWLIKSSWLVLGAFAIWGFVQGAASQILPLILLKISGDYRFGLRNGILNLSIGGGNVIGPLFVGMIIDMNHGYNLVLIIFSAVLVSQVLLVWILGSSAPVSAHSSVRVTAPIGSLRGEG